MFYLVIEPVHYLRFTYNEKFSCFTLRGKTHWTRTAVGYCYNIFKCTIFSIGDATSNPDGKWYLFFLLTCLRVPYLLSNQWRTCVLYIIILRSSPPFGAKNTGPKLVFCVIPIIWNIYCGCSYPITDGRRWLFFCLYN
jgi:hypothetical protein